MDNTQIFRSNTLMILVPGFFFGVALILRSREDLAGLMWVLLAIGLVTTIALISSFTTLTITDQEIRIKNLKKSQVIDLKEITNKDITISTSKGIESVVWKLYLKNGAVVKVSSDLFKDKERLRKSLDAFLKRIPNTQL